MVIECLRCDVCLVLKSKHNFNLKFRLFIKFFLIPHVFFKKTAKNKPSAPSTFCNKTKHSASLCVLMKPWMIQIGHPLASLYSWTQRTLNAAWQDALCSLNTGCRITPACMQSHQNVFFLCSSDWRHLKIHCQYWSIFFVLFCFCFCFCELNKIWEIQCPNLRCLGFRAL